jgi:deoxycytidylate deaminase
MNRDASAKEPSGQHVSDAFHLGDFFIDNTADQEVDGKPNPAWDINEHLSRLVKILTHSELVRPEIGETAMHHAQSARMRSACLSRQVGAALVDKAGNLVSTGTNEVPRAGGGVYGESFDVERDDARCAMHLEEDDRFCRNTRTQNEIVEELISSVEELKVLSGERRAALARELKRTQIGGLIEFSRAVHAEMDAILSAARTGVSPVGTRLFVTTFPCHYCARHIVSAGIDEVQYIEPYPKSRALKLHPDAIKVDSTGWSAPSESGTHVLFRPFSGVAPRMYKRAFMKDRSLKDDHSGKMEIGEPEWGEPWHLAKIGYPELEAELTKEKEEEPECSEKIPPTATR